MHNREGHENNLDMPAPRSEEVIKITISLSGYEYRMLKYWAKIHGKPLATYSSQVLGARVESNYQSINEQMKLIAEQEEITPEELRQRWDGES